MARRASHLRGVGEVESPPPFGRGGMSCLPHKQRIAAVVVNQLVQPSSKESNLEVSAGSASKDSDVSTLPLPSEPEDQNGSLQPPSVPKEGLSDETFLRFRCGYNGERNREFPAAWDFLEGLRTVRHRFCRSVTSKDRYHSRFFASNSECASLLGANFRSKTPPVGSRPLSLVTWRYSLSHFRGRRKSRAIS